MFEVIEGLRNRELTEDQYKLVSAIKSPDQDTLYDSFQEFWKERCWNTNYLSDYDSWQVLQGYATDMFDRSDWFNIKDGMRLAYWKKEALTTRDMSEIYLSAIQLMKMRYEI